MKKNTGERRAAGDHRGSLEPAATSEKRLERERRREERKQAVERQRWKARARRVAKYGALAAAGVAILGLGTYRGLTATVYPPTGIEGHVESFPPRRIMDLPIDEAVQKHILEHGGREGKKEGILIQYKCPKPCPELVEQLKKIAERYPDDVWMAPYPRMSPRIALTTRGKLEAIEEFNEERILDFIRSNL